MNYWKELENRSVLLWRSLLRTALRAGGDTPVHIDAASAETISAPARKRTGAADRPEIPALPVQEGVQPVRAAPAVPAEAETDGLQPRRTDGQAALQVLRGLSEVSLSVERAQRDTTETFAPGFAEPPDASRKTADGGAAALWKTLRTVSETQIAQSPPAAASTPHAPPAGNGGENWPELLERDARRYDGGYDFI